MRTIEFKTDKVLFSRGDELSNIYYIMNGEAIIDINTKKYSITNACLGEWLLIDMPSQETVTVKNGTKLLEFSIEEMRLLDRESDILMKIFKSVTEKLLYYDEILSRGVDTQKAMETFFDLHEKYIIKTSDTVEKFNSVKLSLKMGNVSQAEKIFSSIDRSGLDSDFQDEYEVLKITVKFFKDRFEAVELFNELDSHSFSKRLSYQYLQQLISGGKNTLINLYGTSGIHLPSKTVIIIEGEEDERKGYLLLKGNLKVGRYSSGVQKLMSIIQKGEIFGESAIFSKPTRLATVFTDMPCDIIPLSSETIKAMLKEDFELGLRIIRNQLKRVSFVNELVSYLQIKDKEERIKVIVEKFIARFVEAGVTVTELASLCNVNIVELKQITDAHGIKINSIGKFTIE
ncbi:MAG TPA: cyclic nucleotide-binding domain-containing protein [Petrotogaceae bacterium]|nr:cyclic nucleotide-binding domain-containing protein [Petrotogaceae bacterium]